MALERSAIKQTYIAKREFNLLLGELIMKFDLKNIKASTIHLNYLVFATLPGCRFVVVACLFVFR